MHEAERVNILISSDCFKITAWKKIFTKNDSEFENPKKN